MVIIHLYPEVAKTLAYLLILLMDVIAYIYTLLKIFRILCYTKVTMDQLPLLNPYQWPFSFFRIVTVPYFRFWSILIPPVRMGKGSYDISAIVGLEAIGSFIAMCIPLRVYVYYGAQFLLATFSISFAN
jgi:hypothetical protein